MKDGPGRPARSWTAIFASESSGTGLRCGIGNETEGFLVHGSEAQDYNECQISAIADLVLPEADLLPLKTEESWL